MHTHYNSYSGKSFVFVEIADLQNRAIEVRGKHLKRNYELLSLKNPDEIIKLPPGSHEVMKLVNSFTENDWEEVIGTDRSQIAFVSEGEMIPDFKTATEKGEELLKSFFLEIDDILILKIL